MKIPTVALTLLLFTPFANAERLTTSERETLLERLAKIRSDATSKVDARYKAAMSAYVNAMSRDDATYDLYLKCEEMVNFDEMKKKPGAFREWKRANAERLSDSKFKLALRQQLRWLVLTLEAASEEPDRDRLAVEAGKVVDSIVSQAEDLSAHRGILQQSVTDSVFARAYKINGIKVEKWPLSPAAIAPIYDQVLLPPVRNSERLSALRATWAKRMLNESILIDLWGGNPGVKIKPGVHSPQYDKFVTDTIPKLQWDAEMDQFNAGDQRAAALRMLAHIEKNLAHEAAPQWAAEFTSLLQPKVSATPAPGSTATEDEVTPEEE